MEIFSVKPRITMTKAEFQAIVDFMELMDTEEFFNIDRSSIVDTLSNYDSYFRTEDKNYLDETEFEIIIKGDKKNKK